MNPLNLFLIVMGVAIVGETIVTGLEAHNTPQTATCECCEQVKDEINMLWNELGRKTTLLEPPRIDWKG